VGAHSSGSLARAHGARRQSPERCLSFAGPVSPPCRFISSLFSGESAAELSKFRILAPSFLLSSSFLFCLYLGSDSSIRVSFYVILSPRNYSIFRCSTAVPLRVCPFHFRCFMNCSYPDNPDAVRNASDRLSLRNRLHQLAQGKKMLSICKWSVGSQEF